MRVLCEHFAFATTNLLDIINHEGEWFDGDQTSENHHHHHHHHHHGCILAFPFRFKFTSIFTLGPVCPPGCFSPNMRRPPVHYEEHRTFPALHHHHHHHVDARDELRGFRHELRIRVIQAKMDACPFQPLINATDDFRTCVQCAKLAPMMMRCSGCKCARYCDRGCQKANWRNHRTECCPDHSLPTYQRSIALPYVSSKVCQSCLNISRRVACLTLSEKMFIHRRCGEERCAAMSVVSVPSAVSAPSAVEARVPGTRSCFQELGALG